MNFFFLYIRNFSSLDREEMLSTLLYGAEEYGPEESVHIQLCVQDFIGEISIA